MDGLVNQLGIAALVPLVIEWLKRSRLPGLGWIHEGTVVIARLLSLLAAAATAAGLVVGFDGSSWWSAGTLTVQNLSVVSAAAFAWHTIQHFAIQEIVYRGAVKPDGRGF